MLKNYSADTSFDPLDDDDLEQEPESDEEGALAGALVRSLVKAINTTHLYPADNPLVTNSHAELAALFHEFLSRYDTLILQISETEIHSVGRLLHADPDLQTSLPFLLYNDGLRELRFTAGLAKWEIIELITIINRSSEIDPLEDDLVILLWEKEFIHIDYLAVDDFLEITSAAPENIEQYRDKLVRDTARGYLEEEHRRDGEAPPEPTPAAPPRVDRALYILSEEEKDALRHEVEQELSPEFVFRTADVIFDIFALERDQEPYQYAADILRKIFGALLTLEEYGRVNELLRRVYASRDALPLENWQRQMIQQVIAALGDREHIQRISRALRRPDAQHAEAALTFLRLLPENAIPPIIVLFEDPGFTSLYPALCEVLAEIGKSSAAVFFPYLVRGPLSTVRHIAQVLGRIGNPSAISALTPLLLHKDAGVRLDVVKALGEIGGDRACKAIIRALADAHLDVRCGAAVSLGHLRGNAAVTALLQAVRDDAFWRKPANEIVAYLNGVGDSRAPEAVSVLRHLLEQRVLFANDRVEAVRYGAARALALIGTPEARAVLQSHVRSRDALTRIACQMAQKVLPPEQVS